MEYEDEPDITCTAENMICDSDDDEDDINCVDDIKSCADDNRLVLPSSNWVARMAAIQQVYRIDLPHSVLSDLGFSKFAACGNHETADFFSKIIFSMSAHYILPPEIVNGTFSDITLSSIYSLDFNTAASSQSPAWHRTIGLQFILTTSTLPAKKFNVYLLASLLRGRSPSDSGPRFSSAFNDFVSIAINGFSVFNITDQLYLYRATLALPVPIYNINIKLVYNCHFLPQSHYAFVDQLAKCIPQFNAAFISYQYWKSCSYEIKYPDTIVVKLKPHMQSQDDVVCLDHRPVVFVLKTMPL